ncbi:MAG: hypothetical protein ACM3TN_17520 [Alphaproteobacteria bacterium]
MTTAGFLPALWIACLAAAVFSSLAGGAENGNPESGQLTLRKSIGQREYKGKTVEGEDRRIAPGDSLWRILIQEKGLSTKHFSEYIVVIRGLNPGLSPSGALRIGETIFIPLRPDEVLQGQDAPSNDTRVALPQPGKGATQEYRIKQGEYLYQILRERLGITDERQLAVYYALVKDLNPQRKNWDLLVEGETIRLPVFANTAEARSLADRALLEKKSGTGQEAVTAAEAAKPGAGTSAPPPQTAEAKPPAQSSARENVALMARVMESLGNEVQRNGEEVVAVKDGVVRLEKNSFPLVYNRKLNQAIILDADEKIPSSMRSKLSEQNKNTTVLSLSRSMSVHDAVSQLLSRLGYQPLPAGQPIVLQQGGLTLEAKGEWTVLAPEESHKRQEIFVINISDKSDDIPDYLRAQLAASGVHLKDISWGSTVAGVVPAALREPRESLAQTKTLPHDKREIVDALLFADGVSFGVSEAMPVALRPGIKVDITCDRLLEMRGQRIAVFFRGIEPEIKQALEQKESVKVVELDLTGLSSRELIGKLFRALGEHANYEEHRFNAATGAKQDKLVISAWGFLVSKPAMFVTDRQIPKEDERFFFEKGLDIVYFQ